MSPTDAEGVLVVSVDAGLTVECRVGVPETHQVKEPVDHRALEGRLHVIRRVVPAIDGPSLSRLLDRQVVVLASQKTDVVDLGDALREKLDRPGGEISLVVAIQGGVVRAVQLVDIDRFRAAL